MWLGQGCALSQSTVFWRTIAACYLRDLSAARICCWEARRRMTLESNSGMNVRMKLLLSRLLELKNHLLMGRWRVEANIV